jgi:hypothetical protein
VAPSTTSGVPDARDPDPEAFAPQDRAPEEAGLEGATSPLPFPRRWSPGLITGGPLLVGGADLVDSLSTLVAYNSSNQAGEVLHATVTEEAEGKLFLQVIDKAKLAVETCIGVESDITN